MSYFILGSCDQDEQDYLIDIPDALVEEAKEYMNKYSTSYHVGAVVAEFAETPQEITSLRRFLENDLNAALRMFWGRMWVEDKDFSLETLEALAKEGKWGEVAALLWEIKQKEMKAAAPYKVYTIKTDDLGMTGAGILEETGEEWPLEVILQREYGQLGIAVADLARGYMAGQTLLKQIEICEGKEGRED